MRDPRDFYVIAYDIADDGRRARLANALENFGPRIQRSLFECSLTQPLLKRVRDKIREIVEPEKDCVRIYQLCDRCLHSIEAIGGAPPPSEDKFVII